jgi:hypothetical protein
MLVKPKKYIVKPDVRRIVEQMGNVNLKNPAKTITLEKWLIVTPN